MVKTTPPPRIGSLGTNFSFRGGHVTNRGAWREEEKLIQNYSSQIMV